MLDEDAHRIGRADAGAQRMSDREAGAQTVVLVGPCTDADAHGDECAALGHYPGYAYSLGGRRIAPLITAAAHESAERRLGRGAGHLKQRRRCAESKSCVLPGVGM